MDLEVIGRHALLFDDDATSAFVNSPDALLEWNSLSIDRYDVRHLLTSPPPPRSCRRHRNDDSGESELDRERYRDLPSQEEDGENEPEQENTGHYNAVPFSYGEPGESTTEINNTDGQPGFQPPFLVPEDLLQHLPASEKVHQIIARTAMFVSKHGGQSEIVLRVKQGDNPTFGFLMPDHNLHPYFRFLVDHQEVLNSDVDGKYIEEEYKAESGEVGALSLLGSIYGSGDDEEAATESLSTSTRSDSGKAAKDVSVNVSHGSGNNGSHVNVAGKDETVSKLPIPSLKNRAHIIKRNRSISTVKGAAAIELHKESEALGLVSSAVNSLQASGSHSMPKGELPILEPPSELKRVVEKIVEFIVRNGKEFEAVLIQQDTKHGRFPFLLPSNQYHPYYLKVLQKADDARLSGKAFVSGKNDSLGHGERATPSKENNIEPLPSDIPYDSNRKEKFKMVLGKSKKDGEEQTSKVSQTEGGFSIDAAAAAAILQAATKGIKYPNLDILSRGSLKGAGSRGNGGDSQNSNQNIAQNGNPDVSAAVAKVGARTADSGEADSSETRLTRDQKLKSERLKRARMFAAMIKSGAAPLKSEPSRGLSLEPLESNFPGSGADVPTAADRGSQGSTVPLDVDTSDKVENFVMKESVDSYNERRSKRKYRSRSNRDGEGEEEEVEEDKFEHSIKKRRSHHSSRRNRDRHKHSKKRSSKDKDSTYLSRNYSSSEEQHSGEHQNQDISTDDEHNLTDHATSSDVEYKHSKRRHKHDTTGDKHRRSRHRHKRDGSSDDEHHKHSRRKNKHDGSRDDEHLKSSRHKKRHDRSSDDEHYKRSPHAHKYGRSSDSDDEHYKRSRHTHRHGRSSDDEHRYTRRRHKYNCSSDEENDQQIKSVRYKRSQSEKEAELEEGEIFIKSDPSKASERGSGSASREASVDLQKSYQDVGSQSQASNITGVSDGLRAKIRAMLMETL